MGSPSKELQELLHYMEETTNDNACNKILQDIHEMVTKIKQDREVTLDYMKTFEHDKMIFDEGRSEGREEGQMEMLVSLVLKKLKKHYRVPEIADMLEKDEGVIQRICDAAEKYAPDYDEGKCTELLKQI